MPPVPSGVPVCGSPLGTGLVAVALAAGLTVGLAASTVAVDATVMVGSRVEVAAAVCVGSGVEVAGTACWVPWTPSAYAARSWKLPPPLGTVKTVPTG
ncbi:MAG: hypothetical protein ABJA50_00195 [Chloroflexota bacterium]